MTVTAKKCGGCGETKMLTDFQVDRRRKDGHQFYCRQCKTEQRRIWCENNPGQQRETHMRRRYGITSEQYDEMLRRQNGVCAICKKLPKGRGRATACLNVDHDHETGRVRGLLCWHCNLLVGKLEKNSELLHLVEAYLGGQNHLE